MDRLPRPTLLRMEPDELLPDIDAHSYLQGVYRGTIKANNSRLRAAMAALPFERPKLAVVASASAVDLAELLERALAQSQKVVSSRPVQVIEHQPREPLDHSKPFAYDNKSRFRRF